MFDRMEAFFYAHMYGEWESLRRWLWIYAHVSILLATALAGYAFARGASLLTLLLAPFPLVYLYKRYEKHGRTKFSPTRRSEFWLTDRTIPPGGESKGDGRRRALGQALPCSRFTSFTVRN